MFVSAPGDGEGVRGWRAGASDVGEVGEGWNDDSACELSEESGDASSVGGDPIGVGSVDAFDEALESESAQVIRRLRRGVFGFPQDSHVGAQ